MGFADQGRTTIKNNRALQLAGTTIKKHLENWYGVSKRNPPYQELKAWRKSEVLRRAKTRSQVLIIFFSIAALVLLIWFFSTW